MVMATIQVTVSLDGLRTNIMHNYAELKELLEEITLEQHRDGDSNIWIERNDMERIYQAVNELRENIGALNCCSCADIEMSNLSHINQQRGMGYIQWDKEDKDE